MANLGTGFWRDNAVALCATYYFHGPSGAVCTLHRRPSSMLFNLQIQLINFHTIVTLVGFSYMWLSTFIHII